MKRILSFCTMSIFFVCLYSKTAGGGSVDSNAINTKDVHSSHQVSAKNDTKGKKQELCVEHAVSKKLCFICDKSLRDQKRMWCMEHKRYEDRCFICHPEIQDKSRLYCNEHGLYEDECLLCHPELKKK